MGPLLTIISYLIKQHEGGLVYHLKMPKTILSEKLTPFDYFLLFVQTAWNETIKCKNAFRKKLKLDVGPLLRIFVCLQTAGTGTWLPFCFKNGHYCPLSSLWWPLIYCKVYFDSMLCLLDGEKKFRHHSFIDNSFLALVC